MHRTKVRASSSSGGCVWSPSAGSNFSGVFSTGVDSSAGSPSSVPEYSPLAWPSSHSSRPCCRMACARA
eukprot:15424657-Alexandrium_andersonii.AAC.1